MNKFYLIARREYLKHVRRRSFLLATFGLPVAILLMMALSVVVSDNAGGKIGSVGYVDESGVLASQKENPGFRTFSTVEAARAELVAGNIEALYILPEDYMSSGRVQLVYSESEPAKKVEQRFDSYLKANLVTALDPALAVRALDGPDGVVVRSVDGTRQSDSRGLIGIALPFAFGFFISFALMSASSYLLQAITDEKENRTMEVMVTSVSPNQFIGGKAVGVIGVALTQVLLWTVVVVGGLAVVSRFVDSLGGMSVPWSLMGVLALYLVPLLALASSMVLTLGVVSSDSTQDQQMAAGMSILFLLPLVFSPLLGTNPDGPAMVALTLFPTTAPLTIAARWGATVVPLWQLILSWVILAGCAGFGLWAAPRVFRAGMLRYGRRMSLLAVARNLGTSK
jgi:ABC-2 type transport system permease protein